MPAFAGMTDMRLAATSHSGESRNPVQENDQALDVLNGFINCINS